MNFVKRLTWTILYFYTIIKIMSKCYSISGHTTKKEFLEFPFCCKVSADIITSFLQMIYGEYFHFYCTQIIFPHSWTEYKSKKEHFIIDFTDFQFEMSDDDKVQWRKRLISQEEVTKRVHRHNPIQEQSAYVGLEQFVIKEKCLGLKDDYSVELTKYSFMNYLKSVIDDVYKNTRYEI